MWQPFHADIAYYEDRARGLHGRVDRQAVAAEHGCADWDALVARVAALDREPFARAYRAIEAHDPDALRAELDAHPEVARQEGTNGNDLLGHGDRDRRRADGRAAAGGAAPTRRTPTRTAGRRCTRPATRTCRTSPACCSTRAPTPRRSAAGTAARRWWPRCSGATGR